MNRNQRRQLPGTTAQMVCLVFVIATAFGWIGEGAAFLQQQQPPPSLHRQPHERLATTTTTTKLDSTSDADLLKDLPFLPEEVMAKFMKAVGDPLTAGSLQAGYQAGVVSDDDLQEIRTRLPGMEALASNDELPNAQTPDVIEAHWKAALQGQPWHVQAMGKLATPTIVPLVAKLQENSVKQAGAMKWINQNALPLLQNNDTIVRLLLSSSFDSAADSSDKLVFNNTRAKYETDRGVWSASMDVFAAGSSGVDSPTTNENLSQASAALAALTEGLDDDDDLASFRGTVDVLERTSTEPMDTTTTTTTVPAEQTTNANGNKIGLVNAYFVPDDEIKILVVEIDDVLHNVTWKGLS